MNESGAERGNGEGSSITLCGTTHEPSARQLPTNDDHEGGFGRSSNISVIKRRSSPPRPCPVHFTGSSNTEQRKKSDLNLSLDLAGSFHINGIALSCGHFSLGTA